MAPSDATADSVKSQATDQFRAIKSPSDAFDAVDKMVAGARVVVLVVDIQHDFTRSEGVLGSEGRNTDRCGEIVPSVNSFLSSARARHIPIVFTQMIGHPDFTSEAGALIRAQYARDQRTVCAAGSWGAELDSDLSVLPGDHVIVKHRASAFVDTDLEKVLHGLGCEVLLVCGLTAEVCVDSTARHAFMLDYHVVLIEDLISSLEPEFEKHAVSVIGRHFAHVRSSRDVKKIWNKQLVQPINEERH